MADTIRVVDAYPFEFYGETFYILLTDDKRLYVPLAHICRAIHIDTDAQVQRIRRDAAIDDSLVKLPVEVPHGEGAVRRQEMNCLWLKRLPYWLGTIDASRIRDDDVQERVIAFKRDFADVAWAAYRSRILPEDVQAELDANLPPDVQAYYTAMDEAARLRRQIGEHGDTLADHEERLARIEARLVGTDFLTPQQAKQTQDMVAAIAEILKNKGKGGYATVHGAIKEQFQVNSYKVIPEDEFPKLQRFLAQWYDRLTPPGTPLPPAFRDPSQGRLL